MPLTPGPREPADEDADKNDDYKGEGARQIPRSEAHCEDGAYHHLRRRHLDASLEEEGPATDTVNCRRRGRVAVSEGLSHEGGDEGVTHL